MSSGDVRLDHCYVAVENLEDAARLMRALGFRVSGRNVHSAFGTANHLIVFDRNYIELISPVNGGMASTPEYRALAARLANGGGWTRTALDVDSIDAKRSDLARAGIVVGPTKTWRRKADLGNGQFDEAIFSTADIITNPTDEHDFFFCRHHNPPAVYAAHQTCHLNGALRIIRGDISVDEPQDFHPLLEALFPGEIRSRPTVVDAKIEPTRLRFHRRYNNSAQASIRILVHDLGIARNILVRNDVSFEAHSDELVITAAATPGFELRMTTRPD